MNLIKEILLKDFSTYEAHRDRKLLTIQKDRKKVPSIAINERNSKRYFILLLLMIVCVFYGFQKDKNQIHERTCTPINYQFLPKYCALKQVLDTQLLVKVREKAI